MRNSTIEKAVVAYGGQSALARVVGVTPQAVQRWCSVGEAPVERCAAIEQATGGRVTRKDLRPADWQKIWPELSKS